MRKVKSILIVGIIILISSQIIFAQELKKDYTVIEYSKVIDEGKELDENILFEGPKRKIAQVTMRDGKSLGAHSVDIPFLVYCTAGTGDLILGKEKKSIELNEGIMITVEADVPHDVIAQPELSIIVIRFLHD